MRYIVYEIWFKVIVPFLCQLNFLLCCLWASAQFEGRKSVVNALVVSAAHRSPFSLRPIIKNWFLTLGLKSWVVFKTLTLIIWALKPESEYNFPHSPQDVFWFFCFLAKFLTFESSLCFSEMCKIKSLGRSPCIFF